MPMLVPTLMVAALAVGQQQPLQRYADGQEVKICGQVLTTRANPSTCETTLRVSSAGEEFDVLIPASLQKRLTPEPARLRGAEACFTGRVSLASGNVRVTAATSEITALPPGPAFGEGAVVPCGGVVTMPQVLKERKPVYPQTVMRSGVQGTVEVEAVVDIDGAVADARVVRPLHPELDEQAIAAVRDWKFVPGVMNGKPVPVLITIEMTFTVRK
jgi:TonB family protein